MNPLTGRITWIVSFLAPVHPFRLFNASELSNPIEQRAPITHHDLGCQGYCNPVRCRRLAHCSMCSTHIDQHDGPVGANCTQEAQCTNCHGPFPAGHEHCPAAPQRKDGKVVQLMKTQLRAIRHHGERNFQAMNAPTTNAPTANAPTPAQELELMPQVPSTAVGGPKRKRGMVITAHENAGSQDRIPDSQPPSTSGRPRHSMALGRSLNLAELSARSLRASPPGDMEINGLSTLC